MTDQDNDPTELGPIAGELAKLAQELRELAETPLFSPEDVANDDRAPVALQALPNLKGLRAHKKTV